MIQVPNIYHYEVNNERCRLIFGPVRNAGTYYFYYLPYEVQEAWGGYGKDYLKPEKEPSAKWIEKNHVDSSIIVEAKKGWLFYLRETN